MTTLFHSSHTETDRRPERRPTPFLSVSVRDQLGAAVRRCRPVGRSETGTGPTGAGGQADGLSSAWEPIEAEEEAEVHVEAEAQAAATPAEVEADLVVVAMEVFNG